MGMKKAEDLLDDEFRQSYFRQLVGQYKTLGSSVVNPEARKRGDILAEMPPDKTDWNDVYELETLIIKLEPTEQLREHLWSLREEFQRVAPSEYAAYEKARSAEPAPPPPPPAVASQTQALDKPATPPQAQSEKMRAEAVRIQEELNWYYTVLWVQETFRANLLKRLTRKTFKLIGAYALLGLVLVILSCFVVVSNGSSHGVGQDGSGTNHTTSAQNEFGTNQANSAQNDSATNHSALAQVAREAATAAVAQMTSSNHMGTNGSSPGKPAWEPPKTVWGAFTQGVQVSGTYFLVVVAGTLGGLTSVLRRIQKMSLDGNSDTNLVELEQNSSSIDFSPLLGAVFALLLFFMFMSALLSGTLFPEFPKDHPGVFLGCVPSKCSELAKLIVWSFVAGFAEKFVPDALDRLQTRSTTTEKTPAATK